MRWRLARHLAGVFRSVKPGSRLPWFASGIVALLTLVGCSTIVGYFILPREGVREKQYAVDVHRNIAFQTSDGVLLVSDIYRPPIAEKIPTILVRIPFSNTFRNRLAADVIGDFWASRGYNVVIQGTRGRYKSGGEFYPLLHERRDGVETLAWLSHQPWFDG